MPCFFARVREHVRVLRQQAPGAHELMRRECLVDEYQIVEYRVELHCTEASVEAGASATVRDARPDIVKAARKVGEALNGQRLEEGTPYKQRVLLVRFGLQTSVKSVLCCCCCGCCLKEGDLVSISIDARIRRLYGAITYMASHSQ